MAEFLQSLESSWQLQREGGGGGFYLTMALPMGSRLWSGCLTFPTLLAPPPLPLAACLPSAWAPGATLILHPEQQALQHGPYHLLVDCVLSPYGKGTMPQQ